MPAATNAEVSPHSGKLRWRCEGCGKIAFISKSSAAFSAEKVSARAGVRLRAYYDEECGWWHLTRSATRRPRPNRTAPMYVEVAVKCPTCGEGTIDLQASCYLHRRRVEHSAPFGWQQSCYCKLDDDAVMVAAEGALVDACRKGG